MAICIGADSWKIVASQLRSILCPIIRNCALQMRVDSRDIEKQLLLHLPRFTPDELGEIEHLRQEGFRHAEKLAASQSVFRHWSERHHIPILSRDAVEART